MHIKGSRLHPFCKFFVLFTFNRLLLRRCFRFRAAAPHCSLFIGRPGEGVGNGGGGSPRFPVECCCCCYCCWVFFLFLFFFFIYVLGMPTWLTHLGRTLYNILRRTTIVFTYCPDGLVDCARRDMSANGHYV